MPDGLLYGTASEGGRPIPASGYLFRIGKDGSDYEVLHELLPGAPNGRSPWGGFLKGRDGALYGTTLAGGANGAGVIFKLARAGGQTNLPATLTATMDAGNTFRLTLTGSPLASYEIQATGQLPADRQTVTNLSADANGVGQYSETISAFSTSRLFRAVGN